MSSFWCLFLFVTLAYSKVLYQDEDRIIDGKPIEIKEVPHQVSVHTIGDIFYCGGNIISKTVILTAAHCLFLNPPLFIRAGSDYSGKGGQVREIVHKIAHPKYNKNTALNDIGLFFLKEPLELNEYVSIAKLASSNSNTEDGTICTAVGWGYTRGDENPSPILLQVQMPIYNQEKCHQEWGVTIEGPKNITETQICVGDKDSQKNTCSGDSGGPLICKNEVVGVVSMVEDFCNITILPSVFTRVSFYRKWIDETCQLYQ